MMDVVLVSACQKNALRRTRAVLDRYAFRISESSWSTPITQEGLRSLHTHLRATASRNTAVLCYRHDRKRGLVPLWIVGNRSRFDAEGHTPIFVTESPTRGRTRDSTEPSWWRKVKRIAAISGHLHDLGKNNEFFAQKIMKPGPVADPIRHEWISTRLVEELLAATGGATLDSVWDAAVHRGADKQLDPRISSCQDAYSATLFCVATHHRMLNEEAGSRSLDAGNLISDGKRSNPHAKQHGIDPALIFQRAAEFPKDTDMQARRLIAKLCDHPNSKPPLYWRAVAFLARAALILADHQVSSLSCAKGECEGMDKAAPFANTVKNAQGKRQPNQTLQWHLQSVGQQAAAMADRLLHLPEDLDGLSPDSLSGVDRPASGRFEWQEIAAQAISILRHAHPKRPMLLAVIAGTGSGKTRVCARLAVRAAQGETARWTTLFNLRTLTLQTGEAYRSFGIQEPDLAVVIGDAMTRKAYESQEKPENEDDADRSLGEDIRIVGMESSLPEWLERFVGKNQNLKDMIAAPVFVSTADYLAPAGDPRRQGRHVMPLLRLMGSDLVLDEIDNYDAKSVAAILRLVQIAALFGRNVIASSATMTPALADALGSFYAHGAAMRAALEGADQPDFACGVLSDLSAPSLNATGSRPAFSDLFRSHLTDLQAALSQRTEVARKGCLLTMPCSEEAFKKTVAHSVLAFHKNHQWRDPKAGKPLSVGLVRVAHIGTAIRLAQFLRQELSDWHPQVACYHSRLFNGHRMRLEHDLDQILRRNENPVAPADHPSVRQHMDRPDVQSGLFIVVATPVEEVGRDHDFDWAVVEPSSTQSIVQVAGRVHRHRDGAVSVPNVGILQYNQSACRQEGNQKDPVFCKPGHETRKNATWFGDHDMQALVDWTALEETLDARLRFDTGKHALARADERALTETLEEPISRATGDGSLWMSNFTYEHWPLRERNMTDEWRYDPEDKQWFLYQKIEGKGWVWMEAGSDNIKSRWIKDDCRWLCPSHIEILDFCEAKGLDNQWAFTVSLLEDKRDDSASRQLWECGYDGIDKIRGA